MELILKKKNTSWIFRTVWGLHIHASRSTVRQEEGSKVMCQLTTATVTWHHSHLLRVRQGWRTFRNASQWVVATRVLDSAHWNCGPYTPFVLIAMSALSLTKCQPIRRRERYYIVSKIIQSKEWQCNENSYWACNCEAAGLITAVVPLSKAT